MISHIFPNKNCGATSSPTAKELEGLVIVRTVRLGELMGEPGEN